MIIPALLCCASAVCAVPNAQPPGPTIPTQSTALESRAIHAAYMDPAPSITDEEVRFVNTHEGITLAGTLTMPEGSGPFPAVVLVSGAGPHDRDADFMGHAIFEALGEHLAQAGIAVLRYDDRGVGQSEGDFSAASPAEFATDALAGVEYLTGRPELAKDRIGVLGHSEGAIAALIAADASDRIAFLISLAGPGLRGIDGLIASVRASGKASGVSARVTRLNLQYFTAFAEIVTSEDDPAEAERLMKQKAEEITDAQSPGDIRAPGSIAPAVSQIIEQLNAANTRFVLAFDPSNTYARLDIPALVLFGKRDPITPYRVHAAAIERAIGQSDQTDTTIESLPYMNHLFQRAKTGSPAEFGQIEEAMSPEALETISEWIIHRFGQG